MKRLRAAAAWTTGVTELGCVPPNTLHAITKTEPASRLHSEVITEYLVFLRDNPLQIKRNERAWQLFHWISTNSMTHGPLICQRLWTLSPLSATLNEHL